MKISKRTYRQMKNLENVCSFDIEKRTACITLQYETPEELIDSHLSRPGKPVISHDMVQYIESIISDIPEMFSADISLSIDDYTDYDHRQILNALKAILENTYYLHDEKRKQSNVLAVLFIIIGFICLLTGFVGGSEGWFGAGESLSNSIIGSILDILAWVFCWEGCALIFLTYKNESTLFRKNMERFHRLSFIGRGEKMLSSVDQEKFTEDMVFLEKREVFARNYILFVNAILLADILFGVFRLFAMKQDITAAIIAGCIIGTAFVALLIISNVSLYLDRGNMKKFAIACSIPVLIYYVLSAVYGLAALAERPVYIAGDIAALIALLVNILCILYMRRQSVEI